MHAITGAIDVDDHRVMNHAIDHGGRDYRITQIFAHNRKIDIGGQDGGLFAVIEIGKKLMDVGLGQRLSVINRSDKYL
jgi:hypothetical protein